jgi:hypothetical protein
MAASKKNTDAVSVDIKNEPEFTKEQLTASERYAKRRDLVNALLEDGNLYTISQVDVMIDNFLNGDFTGRKGE